MANINQILNRQANINLDVVLQWRDVILPQNLSDDTTYAPARSVWAKRVPDESGLEVDFSGPIIQDRDVARYLIRYSSRTTNLSRFSDDGRVYYVTNYQHLDRKRWTQVTGTLSSNQVL